MNQSTTSSNLSEKELAATFTKRRNKVDDDQASPPEIVFRTFTRAPKIGVSNNATTSPSISSPVASNKLQLQQKIRRKPSPFNELSQQSTLPDDEEEEEIKITNLDLIYSPSPPPSTSTSTTLSTHNHVERPFLSPEMAPTEVRKGDFVLTSRELSPSTILLPSLPIQSFQKSLSELIFESPVNIDDDDDTRGSNVSSKAEIPEEEETGIKEYGSTRDSMIEYSFSRMQAMFDNHLASSEEEEVVEGGGNSVGDVMLREDVLDELLKGIDPKEEEESSKKEEILHESPLSLVANRSLDTLPLTPPSSTTSPILSPSSASDSEDQGASSIDLSPYEHRGSTGSVLTDDSLGPMTPPSVQPLSINKRFDSNVVILDEQEEIVESIHFDDKNETIPSKPLSRSSTGKSSRGPPPPRPARLRLPGSAGTVERGASSSKSDTDSEEKRSSTGSNTSRGSSQLQRSSLILVPPPTPPPLHPLPATPNQTSSFLTPSSNNARPSRSIPPPPSSPSSANSLRPSFTNPFEKSYNKLRIGREGKVEEISPALSGDSFTSSNYSLDLQGLSTGHGEDGDKTRDPESFFWLPPPRSTSAGVVSSTSSPEGYYGLGLGLELPNSTSSLPLLPLASPSLPTTPLEAESSRFDTLFSEPSTPEPIRVLPIEKEKELVDGDETDLAEEHESTPTATYSSLPVTSDRTSSLSNSVIANVGGAVVYGIGYAAWKGISSAASLGMGVWNLIDLDSIKLVEEGVETIVTEEGQGVVQHRKQGIVLPGSFRPITPIPEDEFSSNEEEVESVKAIPDLELTEQQEETDSPASAPEEATISLPVDTLQEVPTPASTPIRSHSHTRNSSSISTESIRTLRSHELPAPPLSNSNVPSKYWAPPGLDLPPTYEATIPSSSHSRVARPPSITPSTVSDKSSHKIRKSFFGFGRKEVLPPLPSPSPSSKTSLNSSHSASSISKGSVRIATTSPNSRSIVAADIGGYVSYQSGRTAARRNSISTGSTISPDRSSLTHSTASSSSPTKSLSTVTRHRSILRKESNFDRSRKRAVSISSPNSEGGGELDKTMYSVRFGNATKGLGLRSVAESESALMGNQRHAQKWIGVGVGQRYGNLTLINDEASEELYAAQVNKIRTKWRGFGSEVNWADVKIDK